MYPSAVHQSSFLSILPYIYMQIRILYVSIESTEAHNMRGCVNWVACYSIKFTTGGN